MTVSIILCPICKKYYKIWENNMGEMSVIVVGAGIIGSSAAYFLSKYDGLKVTFIDQFHPAGGPTGRSSAVTHAFYLDESLQQLAIRGREILVDELSQISGGHHYHYPVGMMWVCGEECREDWARAATQIRAKGSRIEELSAEQLKEKAPDFDVDGVALALWEPDFGYADAFGATNALANGARENGAALLQSTKVTGLIRDSDKVTGVQLSDGRKLLADAVLVAAGPWTKELLATIDQTLPIHIERHPMAVLDAKGEAKKIMPFSWCDDLSANYARPDGEGVVLCGTWAGGGTAVRREDPVHPRRIEDPENYQDSMDEEESIAILETFMKRAPAMVELGIRPGYIGLYDMSADDMPILGQIDGIAGLYVSAGSSGHGFKTGPAVGEALAQLIVEGSAPVIAPFSPSRFA
ncbi:NAD(P)/FAD-dependent oxidoreductase [Brucella oryzae]|nr:FAD-dependent oxidoreductase [Brucella oryzae]